MILFIPFLAKLNMGSGSVFEKNHHFKMRSCKILTISGHAIYIYFIMHKLLNIKL